MLFVFLTIGLSACTWSSREKPEPDSVLLRAKQALKTGSFAELAASTNKTASTHRFYSDLFTKLDPEAFLLSTGARDRQFDLNTVTSQLGGPAPDSESLNDSLGYTDQALRSDILNALRSSYALRAGGKRYFRKIDPPVDVIPDDWPELPASLLARRISFSVAGKPRIITVTFTQSQRGLESVQASIDLAKNEPEDIGEDSDLAAVVAKAGLAEIGEFPASPYRIEVATVDADGTIRRAEFVRDPRGWAASTIETTTLTQRLGGIRDERLKLMARRAQQFEKNQNRKPKRLEDFQNLTRDVVDPVSEAGSRDWASWMPVKSAHFRLSDDESLVVECIATDSAGRVRAVTKDGQLVWK
ncbi:MAG: hypothetical protein ACYTDT_00945 [Planctomycetota bacterium]